MEGKDINIRSGITHEDIIRPYVYLINSTKSKKFRNENIDQLNEKYFKIQDREKINKIKEFIEILHNSSLLIDDIEDSSTTRRGEKCAHLIYGIPSTINAGNLMYFEAFDKLVKISDGDNEKYVELTKIYIDSMIKLHVGQGKEIYWRDNKICPSEQEYLEMVAGKTGELFKMNVRLLQVLSSPPLDAKTMDVLLHKAELLGVLYQIQNDISDIDADVVEGKFSYPVIMSRARGLSARLGIEPAFEKVRELEAALGSQSQRSVLPENRSYHTQ